MVTMHKRKGFTGNYKIPQILAITVPGVGSSITGPMARTPPDITQNPFYGLSLQIFVLMYVCPAPDLRNFSCFIASARDSKVLKKSKINGLRFLVDLT